MVSQRDDGYSEVWNREGCCAMAYAWLAWRWACDAGRTQYWPPPAIEDVAYSSGGVRERDCEVLNPETLIVALMRRFTGMHVKVSVTYSTTKPETLRFLTEWRWVRKRHFTAHNGKLEVFDPWPGAHTVRGGRKVSYRKVTISEVT